LPQGNPPDKYFLNGLILDEKYSHVNPAGLRLYWNRRSKEENGVMNLKFFRFCREIQGKQITKARRHANFWPNTA
jgi:hypothetical protein